ncbi:uncharacterized protein LOC131680786 [Topomyia yanbarensis]|uniref:uncharacterized protein LOC131680786 n=1 Tax=Topomyia yanbarensis TaxID=2498891 RepID=UPI00273BA41D|nr:uncharacterized protein LOC131680786 [Topomyia yanbarensis]
MCLFASHRTNKVKKKHFPTLMMLSTLTAHALLHAGSALPWPGEVAPNGSNQIRKLHDGYPIHRKKLTDCRPSIEAFLPGKSLHQSAAVGHRELGRERLDTGSGSHTSSSFSPNYQHNGGVSRNQDALEKCSLVLTAFVCWLDAKMRSPENFRRCGLFFESVSRCQMSKSWRSLWGR